MSDYVTEYFDRHSAAWVEEAYLDDRLPVKFPVGEERLRLAIEGVAPAVPPAGALADLGCGGGHLCLHAARLGWRATGVDVAPAMIESAKRLCEGLPVRLLVGSFDDSGLEDAAFDAVTAMGLIEYLPADDALFAEAGRLLRTGGRFAVSCRNRLYNLASLNQYTVRELEAGTAEALLDELGSRLRSARADELSRLADALAAAAEELKQAAGRDRSGGWPELLDHPSAFAEARRQHAPSELERTAEETGFGLVELRALHPHPLPPLLEQLAPRLYNRLALAWQRSLEGSPVGLACCSGFVAVFEKRD